jgi:hypothetical protein
MQFVFYLRDFVFNSLSIIIIFTFLKDPGNEQK